MIEVNPPAKPSQPNKANIDTHNIKTAINNANSQGIKVVKLQNGTYDINETLEISDDLLFIGVDHPNWGSDGSSMPSIRPVAVTKKNCAVIIKNSGAIHGIFFDGVGTNFASNSSSTMIGAEGNGSGIRISEIRIREAWFGIDLTTINAGRSYLNNIFLHNIIDTGLKMGPAFDFPYVSRVHVWNDRRDGTEIIYTKIGLEFGRMDHLSISDCSVFGCEIGLNFPEKYGNEPTLPPADRRGVMGVVAHCKTDACKTAVMIEARNTLSFSGGLYLAHHRGFIIEGEGTNVVIAGSLIKSESDQVIDAARVSTLTITGSTLSRSFNNAATAVIRVGDCHAVTILGCTMNCFDTKNVIERRNNTHELISANNIFQHTSFKKINSSAPTFFESPQPVKENRETEKKIPNIKSKL